MKKIFLLVLVLAIGTHALVAQNNCSKYYPMKEGTTFEYTQFDKKGKNNGTSSFTITNSQNQNGETVATMHMKYADKKGKNAFESNYNITCTGDGIKIDFASLMPSDMIEKYKDMDVKTDISGTDIELPNNLSVGQQLANANVSLKMDMGVMKMDIRVDMINRKVEKREQITTAAGTFDCYLITETNKSETMGMAQEMNSKLWLAEGIGMIKQETYKKNGDLLSRSELSKFSN